MSTRRPSFPQYVADWLGNPAVRLLSPEHRGLLADLKCIAHDGEPYGTITHSNGRELTDEEIARITHTDLTVIRGGIRALSEAKLILRSRGSGKLYVPDMVHREEVRQRRAAGGIKSIEHPNVAKPKQADLFEILEGKGYPSERVPMTEKTVVVVSQNGSSSSLGGEGKSDEKGSRHEYPAEFNDVWAIFPKRAGTNSKVDAFKQWSDRLKGIERETDRDLEKLAMMRGAKRYAAFCDATKKTNTELVMQADRFFGKGMHYLTPYDIPPDTTKPPAAAQMFANSEEALRNL